MLECFANSKILDCNQTIGIPISFSVEGHPRRIHVTKDEAVEYYERRNAQRRYERRGVRSEVTQMISITQSFFGLSTLT